MQSPGEGESEQRLEQVQGIRVGCEGSILLGPWTSSQEQWEHSEEYFLGGGRGDRIRFVDVDASSGGWVETRQQRWAWNPEGDLLGTRYLSTQKMTVVWMGGDSREEQEQS